MLQFTKIHKLSKLYHEKELQRFYETVMSTYTRICTRIKKDVEELHFAKIYLIDLTAYKQQLVFVYYVNQ